MADTAATPPGRADPKQDNFFCDPAAEAKKRPEEIETRTSAAKSTGARDKDKDQRTAYAGEGGTPRRDSDKLGYDKPKIGEEEESDTDSEASDVNTSDDEDSSWITWFCTLKGNEFFCEVDEDYIQDDFNLSGLASQVPYYDYALDLILDVESPNDDMLTEEQHEMVESAAEMLYGLIHARYILTSRGMNAMLEKYKNVHFGRCPRTNCGGQPCLPVGTSDIPRTSTAKTYCPKCSDLYYTRNKYQSNMDGAYFGTTFPHLFLMTFSYLKPPKCTQVYTPRIFGFRIHDPAVASSGGTSETLNLTARELQEREQQQRVQAREQQKVVAPATAPTPAADGAL